ncbi:MAG: hypothetical protein KDA41_14890, partial [Planctomycetales bacterium]|nr:hypothetical protein [Planctomycetales bacterium]
EEGCLTLDSRQAVQAALMNSRDFQQQLETLYLSALDVSFERFRFDAQFFAGFQSQYTADGPERNGGSDSSSRLLVGTLPSSQEGIRMQKLFPAGGQMVVGLANSIVWEFSGPNTQTATTLANLAVAQPLLRGAGKARVMERLTLSERTLLANVRQMERFRRGFYVEIVTGEDAGTGPSRRGGVLGAGLQGFTGIGNGFGGLGGGGGASGFAGGAGAAQAGGYLGLLQDLQNIRNQEFNVSSLQNSLLQLEELAEANRISRLQVEQTRQALYNAQSRLLTARTAFQSTLDGFKVTLGLPPQLCLKIEDPLLDRFNLISPEMMAAQNETTRLQRLVGKTLLTMLPETAAADATQNDSTQPKLDCDDLLKQARELAGQEQAPRERPGAGAGELFAPLVWGDSVVAGLKRLEDELHKAETLRSELARQGAKLACEDVRQLEAILPGRIAGMRQIGNRLEDQFAADRGATEKYAQELQLLPRELHEQLLRIVARVEGRRQRLTELQTAVAELRASGASLASDELELRLRRDLREPLADLLRELSVDVLELTLIQARARTEIIELTPVDLEPQVAVEVACANRRDWANARAALVDTWRLIEFNANDLKSRVDVIFDADIQNVGDNPVNLQATTGRLQARLEFDAPLTRLAERNIYRQSLIEYQQARRNFYAFRDNVARTLRNELRTIDLNKLNFELRRRAVVVAIRQVDLARLRLQEPPKPGAIDAGGERLGDTAARDLVSALSDLLNAQNDFLSVWVNYEVLRRTLDRDLGTMQLDPDGIWVDPGEIGSQTGFLMPADCADCQLEFDLIGPPPPEALDHDPLEAEPIPAGEPVAQTAQP